MESGAASDAAAEVAGNLARACRARLTGFFAESASLGASLVGARSPERLAEAAAGARARFEAIARSRGVDSAWLERACRDHGDLVDWAVQCCRYTDLAIFEKPQPARRTPPDLLHHVASHSGRPVLVVPTQAGGSPLGRRVLVGWTGSRGSTRALHDALPLLQRAEQVTVLSLQLPAGDEERGGYPALDITAHLRTHGVAASYERVIVDDMGMADHMLNRAAELDVDLVVAGAPVPHAFDRWTREDGAVKLVLATTAPVLLSA
jgi:hypothetical protein